MLTTKTKGYNVDKFLNWRVKLTPWWSFLTLDQKQGNRETKREGNSVISSLLRPVPGNMTS